MEVLQTILGLIIIAAHIIGTVIMFGGRKKAPQWIKITAGVGQVLLLMAVFGMSS